MRSNRRFGLEARSRRLGGALVGATLALSGCYKYTPTRLDITPVDENVRVAVTPAGASDLTAFGGFDGPVPMVEGRFVGTEGGNVLLRVPVAGGPMLRPGAVSMDQMIRVPAGEIISVERRQVDRAKTALLVAGAVGGATAIVLGIMQASGALNDTDPGEELTILSIPIG